MCLSIRDEGGEWRREEEESESEGMKTKERKQQMKRVGVGMEGWRDYRWGVGGWREGDGGSSSEINMTINCCLTAVLIKVHCRDSSSPLPLFFFLTSTCRCI